MAYGFSAEAYTSAPIITNYYLLLTNYSLLPTNYKKSPFSRGLLQICNQLSRVYTHPSFPGGFLGLFSVANGRALYYNK